ncbi:pimeloyl-ACP methyl ester carboxylesterase [Bradyrhizobium japonicum]|jgi:pimeloyl-ACP methyl ester carboxylesterase|nr:pimeloyl-ACP methyl ester carboxylesterase [Bradyrhizobium japonicum]MCP1778671.1 pimeloyl-ACP methyl ester carboxylesterase [Bradyrhizobium japonicum]MCP1858107.1 pimeloyl-ACP methyl ester carboxylesterase [Bradyrhizobium japonicum]MCP1888920.1 pimeloyl-ACP methyl ester carboxylesterase [Bradyrhizobium japonicum]MCP1958331.1 pimeloyl-ACP methyl ester carboxylesterase [Bradyrhizobium japonicum]
MSTRLSLLCVHGVGHAEIDAEFRKSWSEAIIRAVQSVDQSLNPAIDFLSYDDLFDKSPPNLVTYGIALAKLLASATVHGIGDLLAGTRSLEDVPTLIRWTAGMVAQWSVDEQLQAALRGAVLDKLKSGNYDVVLAHSLGSLICYDTFVRNPAAIRDKVFVTFGSQIGNPAVRDIFAGRIQDLPSRKWYHLFNREDRVLTYPLEIAADNFQQVLTPFDVPNDLLNHNATWYLSRPETVATVWHDVVPVPASRSIVSAARGIARIDARPTRRALLIGINDYPKPADRLEGCVNDVFLMSSVLQESGFKPDEIRVVLNERATAQGIMEGFTGCSRASATATSVCCSTRAMAPRFPGTARAAHRIASTSAWSPMISTGRPSTRFSTASSASSTRSFHMTAISSPCSTAAIPAA